MYAFTTNQLRGITDIIESSNEGLLKDSDLFVTTIVTDLNNNAVVGWIQYDENGVYGFIPNKNEVGASPEEMS